MNAELAQEIRGLFDGVFADGIVWPRAMRQIKRERQFSEDEIREAFDLVGGICVLCGGALEWEWRGYQKIGPGWEAHHIWWGCSPPDERTHQIAILCLECHDAVHRRAMKSWSAAKRQGIRLDRWVARRIREAP